MLAIFGSMHFIFSRDVAITLLTTGQKRDFRACLMLQARRRKIVPTARDLCAQQQEPALGLTKRRPNLIEFRVFWSSPNEIARALKARLQ